MLGPMAPSGLTTQAVEARVAYRQPGQQAATVAREDR